MTATRDRPSDLDEAPADAAWDERPIIGRSRGLPWWGAVLLAFGLAAIAAAVDMQRQDSLGRIYQVSYVVGCVAAVCWVRRRNLFGPMVQPPLVFAVTAVGAVIVGQPGSPLSSGLKQLIFSVALPLTSNFPTMAITTGVTVAIGLLRIGRERNPEPRVRPSRSAPPREPLEAQEARPEPTPRRLRNRAQPDRARRDRPQPDRAVEQRPRREPDRQRSNRNPDNRDQPPRMGRGRSEPPPSGRPGRPRAGGTPDPTHRQPTDRSPRRDQPNQDNPRRQPRRRPPDDDYR